MARMPRKKLLSEIDVEYSNKHSKAVFTDLRHIGKQQVLTLLVVKEHTPVAKVFFSSGRWINYEIEENKWTTRTLRDYSWARKLQYIIGYRADGYYISPKSMLEIRNYFDLKENVSFQEAVRLIDKEQTEVQRQAAYRRAANNRLKEEEGAEILKQLPLTPLTEKEMEAAVNRYGWTSYCWPEYYDMVYICPHCGETRYNSDLDRAGAYICDYCGARHMKVINVAKHKARKFTYDSKVVKMFSHGEFVYTVAYDVTKYIEFQKRGRLLNEGFDYSYSFTQQPIECMIYAPDGKKYRFDAIHPSYSTKIRHWGQSWWYSSERSLFSWCEMVPLPEEELTGTVFKNLHFEEYKAACIRTGRKNYEYPTDYIRFYHKHPNIENLLMAGFDELVIARVLNQQEAVGAIKFSESRIYKMLSLNKDEQHRAKTEKWSLVHLKIYREMKKYGKILSFEDLIGTASCYRRLQYGDRPVIEKYTDVTLVCRYLHKQCKKYGKSHSPRYYVDYLKAIEKLEYDMTSQQRLFPPDIQKAHDSAVKQVKYTENKRLMESFKQMAEKLSALSFTKDDICIRIAEREVELIKEGEILSHCVGGYGQTHTEGRSIFFVRQANEPDKPWYTLQVNLKTGEQLQLHGYCNERNGRKIPQEVHDFVAYWLANIFQPFDVKKMEFIKPAKKKTA